MDFMKVLDQTVREIKREVNLKVLKVPEIEQKVLDATSDEPWGPHGSALSELAQATKKFSECSMIMNVVWTRLTDTGANWRHVYKALTVIEYLIANGSERAVDDILEHSFRISVLPSQPIKNNIALSSLTSFIFCLKRASLTCLMFMKSLSEFDYVEPNGKDVGINVRKKVETIVAIINDKEKIQTVRNKAAATRDKYFGLSSTGITYKSSASSYGSSDRHGGFGSSREGDSFKDSYKDSEQYKETKSNNANEDNKSKEGLSNRNGTSKLKKGAARHSGTPNSSSSNSSKAVTKPGPGLSSKSSSVEPNITEDDFDDFDPRGSSTGGSANTTSNQVDLFGESLVGDLMDAPTSVPTESVTFNNSTMPEVDLFADASFVSALPHAEATTGSHDQGNIDLFASQPAFPAPVSASVDLFGASDSSLLPELKYTTSVPTNSVSFDPFARSDSGIHADTKSSASESTNTFDPFAAIPLNNFEESDSFGAFTSHTESPMKDPQQNVINNGLNSVEQPSLISSKPAPKRDIFQVKSGIWADSLSRGLIDLNITASKKTSLADIGIVGGLGDASDGKEKGSTTAWYVGKAMASSGTGWSGFTSSTGSQPQQQFGNFK